MGRIIIMRRAYLPPLFRIGTSFQAISPSVRKAAPDKRRQSPRRPLCNSGRNPRYRSSVGRAHGGNRRRWPPQVRSLPIPPQRPLWSWWRYTSKVNLCQLARQDINKAGICRCSSARNGRLFPEGGHRFKSCRLHQFNVDTASEKRFSGKSFGRCEVLK